MDKVIAKFQIVDLQELKVAVEEIWRIAGVHASEINCDPARDRTYFPHVNRRIYRLRLRNSKEIGQ